MKFFYDTEFIDNGRTIDLISIGIVTPDGREYYAVSSQFNVRALLRHPWLVEHVWPHLPTKTILGRPVSLNRRHPDVKPRHQIASEVVDFLTRDAYAEPELWAWYAAYDHVALAQLWGPMIAMPDGLPRYTNDLQQTIHLTGGAGIDLPAQPQETTHHALHDARHTLTIARAIGLVA